MRRMQATAAKYFWWPGCPSRGCKTSWWQWLEAEGISASRREPALHKEIISYDIVMNSCACISLLAAGGSPGYVSVCHRPSVAWSKQRIPFSRRGGEPSSWHEVSLGHGALPRLGVSACALTMLGRLLIFAIFYQKRHD